jgi:hypothetical protein
MKKKIWKNSLTRKMMIFGKLNLYTTENEHTLVDHDVCNLMNLIRQRNTVRRCTRVALYFV